MSKYQGLVEKNSREQVEDTIDPRDEQRFGDDPNSPENRRIDYQLNRLSPRDHLEFLLSTNKHVPYSLTPEQQQERLKRHKDNAEWLHHNALEIRALKKNMVEEFKAIDEEALLVKEFLNDVCDEQEKYNGDE